MADDDVPTLGRLRFFCCGHELVGDELGLYNMPKLVQQSVGDGNPLILHVAVRKHSLVSTKAGSAVDGASSTGLPSVVSSGACCGIQ